MIKVDIPHDALIDITVSGSFYYLLKGTFIAIVNQMPEKEALVVLNELSKGRSPVNSYESQLCVMIALLKNIEDAAGEQNS